MADTMTSRSIREGVTVALDPELCSALNRQTTKEFASAYQYLALAAWLEERSLPGMASWMRIQAEEEWTHALRFFQFTIDRGGSVALGPMAAPEASFESALEVFERALEGEESVTGSINELYSMATELKDYASLPLLDWFVNEQVEEEATVSQIIDDLKLAGTEGHALLMLDRELGTRTLEPAGA